MAPSLPFSFTVHAIVAHDHYWGVERTYGFFDTDYRHKDAWVDNLEVNSPSGSSVHLYGTRAEAFAVISRNRKLRYLPCVQVVSIRVGPRDD